MDKPVFVTQSNLTVPELIQFYEDSIECLSSKLRFFRKRLKFLRSLSDDFKAEPITSEEKSHV